MWKLPSLGRTYEVHSMSLRCYDNGTDTPPILLCWILNLKLIAAHYVMYHKKVPFKLIEVWKIDAHFCIHLQESFLTESECVVRRQATPTRMDMR